MRKGFFRKNKFLTGAFILSAGGIFAKFLGILYRIPLTAALGSEGMGLYQMVFPFYTLLLAVSGAGLPVAVSRLIAEHGATGDREGERGVFITALIALAVSGTAAAALVFLSGGRIASWQGNADAAPAYIGIAPALPIVALISAFRGYFQGRRRMLPTALSQITEQAVKIGAGLYLARLFLPRGVAYAAFGALAGVTVSELAALVQLLIQYAVLRRKEKRTDGLPRPAERGAAAEENAALNLSLMSEAGSLEIAAVGGIPAAPMPEAVGGRRAGRGRKFPRGLNSAGPSAAARGRNSRKGASGRTSVFFARLGRLTAVSFPITLGAVILPVTQLIDGALSINLLRGAGYSRGVSTALYGVLTGPVMSLVNMPAVLSMAVAASAMPAVAAARAGGGAEALLGKGRGAVYLAMLSALPCALALAFGGDLAVRLFYGGILKNTGVVPERALAAQLLALSAPCVLFTAAAQSATAVLQAAGRVYAPVRNLAFGAALKIALNASLIRIPSVHIYGAAVGTAACYALAALLDVAALRKYKLI